MPAPGSAPSSVAPPAEEVVRPPEGLARGLWEAPPVAFYAAGGTLLVSCGLYAAWRARLLPKRRPKA